MDIFDILINASDLGASDVHINSKCEPIARVNGKFIKISNELLSKSDTEKMANELIGIQKFNEIKELGEYDFSISIKNLYRFRVNIYKQQDSYAIAARIINSEIPDLETLGLPNVVKEFAKKENGLVLVTGPTGSGKSTTLASILDSINKNFQKHIITLEDPIEYIYNRKNSIISQREIGKDTKNFKSGLKSVLRQDPDVILIGEIRDEETLATALTAAETGHLVFSTLHTIGAAQTIDRIIDMFQANQQNQIRMQLSSVCEGIISQQLIPNINNEGMVAATEVMVSTSAIKNLIRDSKTHQISNIIQTGSKNGMQLMDQDLVNLFKRRKISKESVINRCIDLEYTKRLIGLEF
ncbi:MULTISPECIES: type IV pilus twitching motility protein PilT [Paraclostridium]|uniref:Type IV pilus twitching motility protein PilT n=1 Tax=Paraclostridium bifermentans TaxID=1490 RepID=A0AA44DNI0_PARBF|nr:type IV pilus twitching motility protein PilT [Paraclostridium bifermentans]MBN8049253.1 type IV pilus twitching motility protein PilT [Paraclostridium bifermentans]MCE9677109.1 type IV pilus twitching motility protein PilT [Paraclostridium bifermentans]MCR1877017.1 type IV pilus twitching motility protein PilT [Paraclostridium bifermentans]NME10858.1 type IV pilus twitching motility protein PilT [Paraclostridium bifermentans]